MPASPRRLFGSNSIAALLGHAVHNEIAWPPLLPLWTGVALLGAWAGTELGLRHVAPLRLRQLLGIVLWVAAGKLLLTALLT